MGQLRLVGSLKSYFSFAEYCLLYRALLQKRPMILRSLLIVATLYSIRAMASMTTWKADLEYRVATIGWLRVNSQLLRLLSTHMTTWKADFRVFRK